MSLGWSLLPDFTLIYCTLIRRYCSDPCLLLQVRHRVQRSGHGSSQSELNHDAAIFRLLQTVLRDHNTYLRSFLTVRELISNGQVTEDIKIVLHADKRPSGEHSRTYNLPSCNEVHPAAYQLDR